jgi:hypothetical protein
MSKIDRHFTFDLRYHLKIETPKNVIEISDISKSFVRAFGAWLSSVFGKGIFTKDVTDTNRSFNFSWSSTSCATFVWGNQRIVFSNSQNDGVLNFTDNKLSQLLTNLTRASGYPQTQFQEDSSGSQYVIIDKYTYAGVNTQIYAMALYADWMIDVYRNYASFMLIKDIFDPPITLETDSVITASYTLRVQV